MRRFTKTCGSILLAASLMLGTVGIVPAQAAEETPAMDPTAFATLFDAVKTATAAVEASTPTKTDASIGLDLGVLVGKVDFGTSIVLNPSAQIAKLTVTASGQSADRYIDKTEKTMYYFNPDNNRYEVTGAGDSLGGAEGVLDKMDFTKLAAISTITQGKGAKVDSDTCQDVTVSIKAEGDALKAIKKDLSEIIGDLQDNPAVASTMTSGAGSTAGFDLSKLNLADCLEAVDLGITFYVNEAMVLRKTDVSGSISIDLTSLFGAKTILPVKINFSSTSSVTDEVVTIPDEFRSKAQLAAGFFVKTAGVKLTSVLSGKSTVFTVSAVTKTKATKLTIPASYKQYGKSYKVTKADKNAFKKAKKLKTLVIKNASLKKTVKKNPTKYGLSKKVKIK